jgi:hypothetical protein
MEFYIERRDAHRDAGDQKFRPTRCLEKFDPWALRIISKKPSKDVQYSSQDHRAGRT